MSAARSRHAPLSWLWVWLSVAILLGAVAAPFPASAAKPGCKHRVVKGDTVSRIARKHGVSEANLVAANRELKKNPNRLRIGQTLEICRAKRLARSNPSKCADGGRIVRHQVDRGDTLITIARKYSVKVKTLRSYNRRLRSSSMIRVGETIRVCTKSRRWTHRSWLTGGVQLPAGSGYERRPHHAWGTPLTIQGILAAVERYRQAHPDAPTVQIGDISRQRGGPLGSHLSHQEGRDVDVFFVFDAAQDGRRQFDVARSWELLHSFLVDDDLLAAVFVSYDRQRRLYEHAKSAGVPIEQLDAWFEYPRNDGEAVVYHWPGHTAHFHARFVAAVSDAPAASTPKLAPNSVVGVPRHRAVTSP